MCQFGEFVLLFGGMAFENDEGAIYNDLYTLSTGELALQIVLCCLSYPHYCCYCYI
jgi:hypothetical protein